MTDLAGCVLENKSNLNTNGRLVLKKKKNCALASMIWYVLRFKVCCAADVSSSVSHSLEMTALTKGYTRKRPYGEKRTISTLFDQNQLQMAASITS